MKRFRAGLAALLLVGGGIAVAEPAQAASYSNCHFDYWTYQGVTYHRYACWIDYSFWEEISYPWPRDHWVFGTWQR